MPKTTDIISQPQDSIDFTLLSDDQVLARLGDAFEAHRLRSRLADKDIFVAGGVKKDALHKFKKGRNISLLNFVKILRGAGLLDRMSQLLPSESGSSNISPIALLAKARPPRRIRNSKAANGRKSFVWGDE